MLSLLALASSLRKVARCLWPQLPRAFSCSVFATFLVPHSSRFWGLSGGRLVTRLLLSRKHSDRKCSPWRLHVRIDTYLLVSRTAAPRDAPVPFHLRSFFAGGGLFAQTQFSQSTTVGNGTLSWTVNQNSGGCGFEGQSSYEVWSFGNFIYTPTGGSAQSLGGNTSYDSSPGGNCPPNGGYMVQLSGNVQENGNTYTVNFYPSSGGFGTASLVQIGAAIGYINPKYVVVGVTYAPPGPQSNVTYAGTTSVGNTTTIANSFSSDVGLSVSVSAGISAWGTGGKITGTESTDYTQGSNDQYTTTISKSTTIAHYTTGTGDAFSPVNSDYDIIWLWLNPVVLLTYTPANGSNPTSMQWNGYGYDPSDPSGRYQPDVYPVAVGWLNGDFGDSLSIDKILARVWVRSTTGLSQSQIMS